MSRLSAALALALRFLVAPTLLAVLRRIARRGHVRVARVSAELLRKLRNLLHQHRHLPREHRDLLLELGDPHVFRRTLRFERCDATVLGYVLNFERCDAPVLRDELALQLGNALVSPITHHELFFADPPADGKLHEIMEQSGSLTRPPLSDSSCPLNGYPAEGRRRVMVEAGTNVRKPMAGALDRRSTHWGAETCAGSEPFQRTSHRLQARSQLGLIRSTQGAHRTRCY